MKKSTIIYALSVSVIGIGLGIYLSWQFFSDLQSQNLTTIISLAIMLILCRSLPLNISEESTIDMSFISILMIFLVAGYKTAAVLYLLTTPLTFIQIPNSNGKVSSIYNSDPIKSGFNMSNIIITIVVSGLVYSLLGGEAGFVSLPGCLLPIVGYVITSMLVNSFLMALLIKSLTGMKISKSLLSGFSQFIPNIVCAVPIGYLLARLYLLEDGVYLVWLFTLPLLLARYSFKMYLEVKHQQYVVISTLSAAIEAKDGYTVGHSRRVEQFSEMIARQMNLTPNQIYTIRMAALFHDIGKIGINDSILNKPGKLSPEERKIIEEHPVISARIVKDIDFYGDIQHIILYHHERYDGKGYPEHKNGNEIPLGASIIAVADAFDAMTSDRPYRKGYSYDKAIEIVKEEIGKQFHPLPANALIRLYDDHKLVPEQTC